MDIKKFADWVKSEFDFDCFENDFFEQSLWNAQKNFEESSHNKIPLEIYHAENLNAAFLETYLRQLKYLLKAIPPQGQPSFGKTCGVYLNAYSNHIDELQSVLQKLES